MQARSAGGQAMGAARDLRGAARHAAYAAGQAGAVAHVAAHELGAAAYAISLARAAAPDGAGEAAGRRECQWQRDQLPPRMRARARRPAAAERHLLVGIRLLNPPQARRKTAARRGPQYLLMITITGLPAGFTTHSPVPLRRRGRVRRDRRGGGRPRRGRDDRRGRPGRLAAAELRHHGEHIGVFDGDRLVAYGDLAIPTAPCQHRAVLPSYQGRGLVRRSRDGCRRPRRPRGRRDRHPGSGGQCAADRLMRDLGYAVERGPRAPPDREISARPLNDGFAIRDAEESDRGSAWSLIEDCFLEWAERDRMSLADFGARVWESSRLRALEPAPVDLPGTIVGATHVFLAGDAGYVAWIAVRPIIGAEVWPCRCWSTPSPWRVNTAPAGATCPRIRGPAPVRVARGSGWRSPPPGSTARSASESADAQTAVHGPGCGACAVGACYAE